MTSKLRVLQVGTGAVPIPPTGAFGIERAIHTLSGALQDAGHEVTLLDVASVEREPVPYTVQAIDVKPWEEASSILPRISRVARFSLRAAARMRSLHKAGAFDVLHCHYQFPGGAVVPLAKARGIPVVYSVHNYIWSDLAQYRETYRRVLRRGNARGVLWLQMERLAIRAADAVTCQTEPIARNVAAELGLRREKVSVFPHALPDSWFGACPVGGKACGSAAGRQDAVVLCVGRLAPVKNQAVLVEALPRLKAEVPSARFLFVGPASDDGYARQLRTALAASGEAEAVTFLEGIAEEELRRLYKTSSLFALPSLAESSPASLLEAMASRTPVVASDIETLRWLLPPGCGVLLPPSDSEAWADAIVGLLKDGERRRQLTDRAFQHAYENHRWAAVVGRLVELYQDVLQAKSRSSRRRAA